MAEDRTAIVTGASSGVGEAAALALAALGIEVAIVARRVDRLQDLARRIEEQGGRAHVVAADLAKPETATRAMEAALRALGHADMLVNCLGVNVPRRSLRELSIEDWQKLVDTNLSAVFYCVRAVVPGMRERGGGRIISVSSMAGIRANEVSGPGYSAAKAGLNMFSVALNVEEGRNGIRSCIIAPGDIDTELLEQRPHPPTEEQRARMLRAEDVAALIVSVVQQPERALVDLIQLRPSGAS